LTTRRTDPTREQRVAVFQPVRDDRIDCLQARYHY